jgi:RNAse (barnase) inhibitor barstar
MNKLPFRIHGANCESQQNFVTKIEYLAQVNHPVENTDAININSEKSTGRNEEALKELWACLSSKITFPGSTFVQHFASSRQSHPRFSKITFDVFAFVQLSSYHHPTHGRTF